MIVTAYKSQNRTYEIFFHTDAYHGFPIRCKYAHPQIQKSKEINRIEIAIIWQRTSDRFATKRKRREKNCEPAWIIADSNRSWNSSRHNEDIYKTISQYTTTHSKRRWKTMVETGIKSSLIFCVEFNMRFVHIASQYHNNIICSLHSFQHVGGFCFTCILMNALPSSVHFLSGIANMICSPISSVAALELLALQKRQKCWFSLLSYVLFGVSELCKMFLVLISCSIGDSDERAYQSRTPASLSPIHSVQDI